MGEPWLRELVDDHLEWVYNHRHPPARGSETSRLEKALRAAYQRGLNTGRTEERITGESYNEGWRAGYIDGLDDAEEAACGAVYEGVHKENIRKNIATLKEADDDEE